jgi:hypothetical protein
LKIRFASSILRPTALAINAIGDAQHLRGHHDELTFGALTPPPPHASCATVQVDEAVALKEHAGSHGIASRMMGRSTRATGLTRSMRLVMIQESADHAADAA